MTCARAAPLTPVLFNLYMAAVFHTWKQRMEGVDGFRVDIRCNISGQPMQKPRRTAVSDTVTECQFADDSTLFATSGSGLELAAVTFDEVASEFGLTVSPRPSSW